MLFVLGWVSGSFDRLEPLIARTDVGDELVAGFLLLSVGVTVLAVRQARRAEREAALRADADEQIRALVAESPVVSFTWLPREHRYRYVSPQVEVLLGVTVEEHMRDWSAQVHPDDRARVEETSRVADRDGATFLAEYRIIRPDGRVRWIHDESHYYDLDASGRPTLAQGVMFDITERKEAEDRAAAAEERYRTLVERVPAISYAWDSVVRRRGRRPRSTSARRSSSSSGCRPRRGSTTRWRGRRTRTPTTRHGSPRRGASRPTPARPSPRSIACGPRPASGSGSATRRPRSDRAPTADSSIKG